VLDDGPDPALSLAEYLSDLKNSDGADLDILWELYCNGDLFTADSWTTATTPMRLFLHGMEKTLPYQSQIRFLGAGINSPVVLRLALSFVTEISTAERFIWLGLYTYLSQIALFTHEAPRSSPDYVDPTENYGFHQPYGVCDLSKCRSLMRVGLRGVCPSRITVSKDIATLGFWVSSSPDAPFEWAKLKNTILECRSLKDLYLTINLADIGQLPKIGSMDARLSIPTLQVLRLSTSLHGVAVCMSLLELKSLHTLILEELYADSEFPETVPIVLPQLRTLVIRGITDRLLSTISMWKLEGLEKLCFGPEYWSLPTFRDSNISSVRLKCPQHLEINYPFERDLIWLLSHMDTENIRSIRTLAHMVEDYESSKWPNETTRICLSNATKLCFEAFDSPLSMRYLEFPSVTSLELPHGIDSFGATLSDELKDICSRMLMLRIKVFGDYDNIPNTLTAFPNIENLTLIINRWEILMLLFQEFKKTSSNTRI
jgi:hypothetical protein